MSTFYVGQRVRVKWCCFMPELGGRETTIAGGLSEYMDITTGEIKEGWPVAIHPGFYPATAQLEPILPSGHRSGDYSYTELMDRLKAGEVECV